MSFITFLCTMKVYKTPRSSQAVWSDAIFFSWLNFLPLTRHYRHLPVGKGNGRSNISILNTLYKIKSYTRRVLFNSIISIFFRTSY